MIMKQEIGSDCPSQFGPCEAESATRLRRAFGLGVAPAVSGHSSPVVTEDYAELDGANAAVAMEKIE
jgi:hypothetical protein